MTEEFVIRFDFDDIDSGIVWYAGWTGDGTLGYAPTLATAARFESLRTAQRFLSNSYGHGPHQWGSIRPLEHEMAQL